MKSLSKIKGQIKNVILYNKKDGFTIAKLKVQNQQDLITAVGFLFGPIEPDGWLGRSSGILENCLPGTISS
jgi:hypothetical protein